MYKLSLERTPLNLNIRQFAHCHKLKKIKKNINAKNFIKDILKIFLIHSFLLIPLISRRSKTQSIKNASILPITGVEIVLGAINQDFRPSS